MRLDAGDAAARMVLEVDAPFARERVDVERRRRSGMGDEFGDVEADAAGAMIATRLPIGLRPRMASI